MQLSADRRNNLYLGALRGGSPSALLLLHMDEYQLDFDEALEDWESVLARLRVDSSISQEMELARVRSARWHVVLEANRRGQFMASSGALRDLGAAAGEAQAALLGIGQQAPALRIVIEAAAAPEGPSVNEHIATLAPSLS